MMSVGSKPAGAVEPLMIWAPAIELPSKIREFGDWTVVCDNIKICTAGSFSRATEKNEAKDDEGRFSGLTMWIGRKPGRLKRPVLLFDFSFYRDTQSASPLSLHVYYDALTDKIGKAYTLEERETGRYYVAENDIPTFLAESSRTNLAAIRSANGEIFGIITTKGLNASLRYVDWQQGRVGTITALLESGHKSWQSVPPKPRKPWVYAAGQVSELIVHQPATEAVEALRAKFCGSQLSSKTPDAQAYQLVSGDRLWSIECGFPRVRNPRLLWITKSASGQFKTMFIPGTEGTSLLEMHSLPNSDFDPKTGIITGTFKETDAGDCGWQQKWAWTGNRFKLVQQLEMLTCDGRPMKQWFRTYQTALGGFLDKPYAE
ncbi:MAG: DUF1176 domain-containing protein [Parasphingorhabdus sp.]